MTNKEQKYRKIIRSVQKKLHKLQGSSDPLVRKYTTEIIDFIGKVMEEELRHTCDCHEFNEQCSQCKTLHTQQPEGQHEQTITNTNYGWYTNYNHLESKPRNYNEEPTLWTEFDEKFNDLGTYSENDIKKLEEDAMKYLNIKDWLFSKLLELAEGMRMEEKNIAPNRSTDEKRYPHGYNEAVREANRRLDTFISKIK